MNQRTKEKTLDWLFNQGIAAVLLFCILGFLGYGTIYLVPDHLDQIQRGYQQNASEFKEGMETVATSNKEGMEAIADAHERGMERIASSHEKDRDLFIQLLELEKRRTYGEPRVPPSSP